MWMKPRVLLVVLLSFLYLLCSASPISQGQEPAGEKKFQSGGVSSSTAKTAASPAEDSKYVGSDTCKTCDEDFYNSWAKAGNPRPPPRLRPGARLPGRRRRAYPDRRPPSHRRGSTRGRETGPLPRE